MKKVFFFILIIILFIINFSVPVFATETGEDTEDEIWSGTFSLVDPDTAQLLSGLGVSAEDMYSVFDISPLDFLAMLKNVFSSGVETLTPLFAAALSLLIILRLVLSFSGEKMAGLTENLGAVMVVFVLILSGVNVGGACVSAVTLTKDFTLSLLPVPVAIAAFSGRPLTSAGVNAGLFAFSSGVSIFFAECIMPLLSVGVSLSTASAISPTEGIGKFSAMLNKGLFTAVAMVSGIFSAVLSIKGNLSLSADSLVGKGARILVGGTVPVVGSAVGEALSSLSGSLSLAGGSVAMLGVLAVACINLPVLCSLISYKIMLFLLSLASEITGLKKVSVFLSSFSSAFTLLIALLIFNALVYVVGLGLLMKIRN